MVWGDGSDFGTRSILSAIAKQVDPPESAPKILTKALNRPVKEFHFHFFGDPPGYRSMRMRQGNDIFIVKGPNWITMDPVRNAAQGLREYLELIPICRMIYRCGLGMGVKR